MKTILIFIASGFVAKNILQTDLYKTLITDKNLRIVLLAPHNKFEYFRKNYASERLIVESLPRERRNSLFYYYNIISRSSIHTNSSTISQYRDYYLNSNKSLIYRLTLLSIRRMAWFLGQFKFWRKALGFIYIVFAKSIYSQLFTKYQPDLIYLTALFHTEEWKLLRETKIRKIKTLYQVAGWDNPSSKVYLPIFPDYILAANEMVKNDLVEYSLFPEDRIYVIGFPQYDIYFAKNNIIPREEFFRKMNADPRKKLMLYGMINPKNMPYNIKILEMIDEYIKINDLSDSWQVLFRPYPSLINLQYQEEELARKNKKFIFDYSVATAMEGNQFEFSNEDTAHLANSLYHSDIVISIFSTILNEAAIFGKPIVSIAFSGKPETTKKDYYESPRRRLGYVHVKKLFKDNKWIIAGNKEELFKALDIHLSNPEKYKEKISKMSDEHCCHPRIGSGLFAGNKILELLNKKNKIYERW